ncbi:MAG: 1-acyl-sn-glycerol-3-phosphate acyltransferase [Spirosomataceae bacterium]
MLRKIINWLAITTYKACGWTIVGAFPIDTKKYPKTILAIAPHNTAWDVPIGLGVRPQMGQQVGFLGKKELFVGVLGPFFKALGGTPVDRTAPHGLVGKVVRIFNSKEVYSIAITPEGTRRNVKELKRGFYHMAIEAKAAIVMIGFDFPRKTVIFEEPFFPSGNWNEDKVKLATFFSTIQGPQKDWIKNYLNEANSGK